MRLVDADKLEVVTETVPEDVENADDYMYGFRRALEQMDKQPTVDAVPVVRCKDCIYWQDNNGGYPHKDCRWGNDETPDPYDYCSFGERINRDEPD